MPSYNKTILVGHLTKDPALRYTSGQTAVCDFGLAVNHRYRTKGGEDREEVLFIDCSAFGKQAETLNTYAQKGKPLLVEGRLRYETWEAKDGGGKRSKHTIAVDNFQFLGTRDGGGEDGGDAEPQTYADARGGGSTANGNGFGGRPAPSQRPRKPVTNPIGDEQQFEDDSIPF